jgi:NAD(P)-dependent dehydrogenase (short-subunit alcohol dehydrogenase family)
MKQNILIIGGSRGIGRAICDSLISENNIYSTYNNTETTDSAVHFTKLDISCRQSVSAFVSNLTISFHAIVFNSGINRRGDFLEMTESDYDEVMNINLKSFVFLIQDLEKAGKLNPGMRLIFISSVASQYFGPTTCHYMLSKVGINALVKFLAQRYANKGILVNAIAPGLILTEQTQTEFESGAAKKLIDRSLLKRPVSVDSLLTAVRFLVDEKNMDLTGHIIPLSGGAIL